MDWITKRAKDEVELMNKRKEQAYGKVPNRYHEFIILLSQSKKIGQFEGNLSNEARQIGAWKKTGGNDVFVTLEIPYFGVDGRIQQARNEHREAGKKLDIDTFYDPNTKLWCAFVTSEIYGKAKGHAIANIGGGGVDRTNPHENAESSAIGRALGFLGYGLFGTGIASAEEVSAALVESSKVQSEPSTSSHASVDQSNARNQTTTSQPAPTLVQAQNATQNAPAPKENELFEGTVSLKQISFPPAPNGEGIMGVLDVVNENGETAVMYAPEPLANALDQMFLFAGAELNVQAKKNPKGIWILLDAKVLQQKSA